MWLSRLSWSHLKEMQMWLFETWDKPLLGLAVFGLWLDYDLRGHFQPKRFYDYLQTLLEAPTRETPVFSKILVESVKSPEQRKYLRYLTYSMLCHSSFHHPGRGNQVYNMQA